MSDFLNMQSGGMVPGQMGGAPQLGGAQQMGGAPNDASGPVPIPPGTNPMEFFLRSVPGYQFAFKEGQRAVQTGAAAHGTLLTGGTQKALTRYGTGIADQLYGDTVNRYLSLADLGLRGATAPFQ